MQINYQVWLTGPSHIIECLSMGFSFGFEPGAVFQLKWVFGKLHRPFQLIPSLLKGTGRRERAKRGNNGKW